MRNFKNCLAVFLAILIFAQAFPLTGAAEVKNKLILSDCSKGWQYAGNSTINYSVSGTEGMALEVVGAYGTLRPLSYSISQIDVSGYDTVEWDMCAISQSGNDVLPDILKAYSDTFYLKLSDCADKEYSYPADEINFTRIGNGWYHAKAVLPQDGGLDLTKITGFSLATLQSIAFCESLPQTKFRIDTVYFGKKKTVEPKLDGAQINDDGNLRFIASVGKEKYEFLRESCSIVESGFLVGNAADFSDSPLEFGAQKPYTNYSSGQLCYLENDEENLFFTAVLSGFDINSLRSNRITVRAYIYCYYSSGESEVFYSSDDYSGGYEVSWDEISAEVSAKEAADKLNNINIIEDETPIIQVKPSVGNSAYTAGEPYAVPVKYDDGTGVCVAIYNVVRDFGAPVNDLTKDSSAYIQRAMNAAKDKGGGVVYIPEGVYRCEKPLTVPGGVTLRGEWQSPEQVSAADNGTVLVVKTGAKDVSGEPFVSLKTGGGFRNISIIYPDNAQGKLTEFSPTIAQTPAAGSDSYTVMNVTILGGTVGFDAAAAWSELHYLKNVYISSLGQGIRINNVTDIGRIENVHISPEYLLENAFIPITAENKRKISDYIRANADGLYIQRSDWEYVYNLEVKGINRGIVFESYIDTSDNDRVRGSNGQMFGVNISDCNTAFDVVYTNAIGYAFTDIAVTNCNYGLKFSEAFMASCEITNLEFSGRVSVPIEVNSQNNGKITVTNSVFGCSYAAGYAVTVKGGNISLQQCKFTQNSKHVYAAGSSGAVSVLGCTFPHRADIYRTSGREDYIKIDNSPLNLPICAYKHVYRRSIPTAASSDVYDVTDYGAISGTDSTDAFKSALAAAGDTGGTVYVPQGEYYVNEPLTVPNGVELRGIYDVPTHSVTKGSVICTSYGRNNENAAAFISLEEGAGINGISFYYPEQRFTDFIPYSWTVQSLGKNCWAKNCVFINSYNALDFGTNPSDGHYINYISGSPLRRGIFIGNNSSNGWVENVQFNPHYWKRANISGLDTTGSERLNNELNLTLESMIFGDNASEHVLATFGYAAKDLLVFVTQGKGGTNGIFIGHGSDGCRNALVAEELDTVVMINSELVSMNYTEDMHHIVMKPTVTGTLAQFNMTAWAQPLNSSIKLDSGKLIIAQLFYHNLENTSNIAEVGGGTLYMSSSMLPIKDVHFSVKDDGKINLKANLSKQTLSTLPPACREMFGYIRFLGAISQTHSWWV